MKVKLKGIWKSVDWMLSLDFEKGTWQTGLEEFKVLNRILSTAEARNQIGCRWSVSEVKSSY